REAEVRQRHLRLLRRLAVERLGAARGLEHAVAQARQEPVQRLADPLLVVHHQHGGRSGLRIGLGHGANVCTLQNPSKPSYLRAPMTDAAPPNLAQVQGITVGHWTDSQSATGCTVTLAPAGGMRAACALRGRATGTRELDALDPRHLVGHIDAVLLTGGSAYGLGAADGVMRWLKERGRGFPVGPAGVVPIVPTAVIFDFDLAPGAKADRWPGADDAYRACAVVATNARLDRVALQALAHAAGDALARRIVPYATPFDGDVVFALSTAQVPAATPLQAEALAALAVPEAVERAVRLARGTRDVPGLADDRA